MASRSILPYYYSLDEAIKKRYLEKLSLINGEDPYERKMAEYSRSVVVAPSEVSESALKSSHSKGVSLQLSYADIVTYLLHTASFVTRDEVKNYKSLASYEYFMSGWVLLTE